MKTTGEIMNTISTSQLFEDACTAMKDGNYYDAMHFLNAYLLFDHTSMSARLKKGLCYLYTDQPDKARFLFDQVLQEETDCAEAYFCYAEYYKLRLDYPMANTYISAAIAGDEEQADYHWMGAEISYLKKDYDSAFSLINRAIVLNPFKEELYYWRALILNAFGKHGVALNDLGRALAINPQYAEALRLRANTRMYMGDTHEALNDLAQARRFEMLQEASHRTAA